MVKGVRKPVSESPEHLSRCVRRADGGTERGRHFAIRTRVERMTDFLAKPYVNITTRERAVVSGRFYTREALRKKSRVRLVSQKS